MGVAVKVTGTPWHEGLGAADIVTSAGNPGNPVMLMTALVSGLLVVQASLDIMMQDTRSPDAGMYVYMGLLVPTFIPFTCH